MPLGDITLKVVLTFIRVSYFSEASSFHYLFLGKAYIIYEKRNTNLNLIMNLNFI